MDVGAKMGASPMLGTVVVVVVLVVAARVALIGMDFVDVVTGLESPTTIDLAASAD